MTVLCAEMGWDYYTYQSQPTWFVEKLTLYFSAKYKAQSKNR